MSDIVTGLCKALSAFAACAAAWLLLGLAITGCATPAPAETFIIVDSVDETFVVAPPDITPVAADVAQEVTPDIAQGVTPNVSANTGSCPCPNCTCDPCECQAVAKAATYRPEQINGAWYCTHNGQRLKWTAVRCYGPDVPCDYEWVPAPVQSSNRQVILDSSPACATGNCGTASPGRTIRRGRGFFGRR